MTSFWIRHLNLFSCLSRLSSLAGPAVALAALCLQLIANTLQSRPAQIFTLLCALARFQIPVTPAGWAKSLTIRLAKYLQRNRQQNLLPQHIRQFQAVARIVAD